MPPINPVLSAGVIAISVAVVAAIVVYENPEVRRMADDLKRRIAIAVQTLGDNMSPDGAAAARRRRRSNSNQNQNQAADEQPLFNRPEDAEGFLMSRGRRSDADPGVVADEATRRRQREELLYWNRQQMQRQNEEERRSRWSRPDNSSSRPSRQPREAHEVLEAMQRATREAAAAAGIHISSVVGTSQASPRPNTSFDHFLRPDTNAADRGTYVMNTDETFGTTSSSNINTGAELVRRRRPEAVTGAAYANPFADEYGIELDEQELQQQVQAYEDATKSKVLPAEPSAYTTVDTVVSSSSCDRDRDGGDAMSDMYSATEPDTSKNDTVFDPLPAISEQQQHVAPVVASTMSSSSKSEVFFDVNNYYTPSETASGASFAAGSNSNNNGNEAGSLASDLSQRLTNALAINESYVNAGQSQGDDLLGDDETNNSAVNTEAFNSIQAWAQNSSSASVAGFYSPLPVTPTVAMSEPSVISSVGDGEPTPTESMSIIGSVAGSGADSAAGDYGVVSEEDSDGIMTPTSWSDVGSVVSENEPGVHA